MSFTLEAALVFPLSITLVLGLVPPAVRSYRDIAGEAAVHRQGARLNADPAAIYALVRLPGASPDTLVTSPKLMFSLVTAILDDLEILGLAPP